MSDIETQDSRRKKLGADFLLLVNTFFWGITFVIVKEAVEQVGVFFFLTQRFALAFFGLFVVCLIMRRPFTLRGLKQGLILGIFLFGGFAFQTWALIFTTASITAFLTGLNVVLVPIFGALIFRHVITRNMQMGVILAAIGLYFLTAQEGGWTFNQGELLGVSCAVCIALHVIFTGSYARMSDVYWLTTIQLGVIAMISALIATFNGYKIYLWHSEIIWALVICVIFASIFAFLVQTSMQRFTTATHTALIFCMEPVFAAFYAYWAINERLSTKGLVGAVLILAGMILSEISPPVSFLRAFASSSSATKRP